MNTPANPFKRAMSEGRAQIGLWAGLADPYCTEIVATAGFDWLLLDGEHAPNDIRSLLGQLQAIAPHASHPIVRVPVGEVSLIKQVLDIGAQTVLVPMVDTPEQAALMAAAMRYPQADGQGGIRGMGAALARASRWSQHPRYVHEANDQVCLLVQAETAEAMKNLDAIAATQGVDGVFIGPADLSASMGHPGNPGHPDVQAAIADGIARILKAGKAPGILATQEAAARHWLSLGARFVAVGIDALLLAQATRELRQRFTGA